MACIAKITETHCPCGFKGELCFTEDNGWQKDCPDCGKVLQPGRNQPQSFYGNRQFAGSERESIAQGMHPNEVKMARRLMPKSADCIKDDGRVFFDDRKQEKTYREELAADREKIGAKDDAIGVKRW